MIDKKWIKITGLAMSFPGTIFISAWLSMSLVEKKIISENVGIALFLGIIFNTIFLMVYYALKNKNK